MRDGEGASGSITSIGLGIAVVSLARFIKSKDPELSSFLVESLRNAESAGMSPEDLRLLRLLIRATTVTSG